MPEENNEIDENIRVNLANQNDIEMIAYVEKNYKERDLGNIKTSPCKLKANSEQKIL